MGFAVRVARRGSTASGLTNSVSPATSFRRRQLFGGGKVIPIIPIDFALSLQTDRELPSLLSALHFGSSFSYGATV